MNWIAFADRYPARKGPYYVSWNRRNVRVRVMRTSGCFYDTYWFAEPKSRKERTPFFERMPTHWAEIED